MPLLDLSTKFQNARYVRAAVNRQGYFLIYFQILKESCSYCNNPEKIQCYQALSAGQAIKKLQKYRVLTS